MSLALSICILFISLMQSVNGVQFLIITFFRLFGCAAVPVFFSCVSVFFDIPLLYCYINLRSSIIFCLSSGNIYVSLGISLSCSLITISELFCCEVFETLQFY